MPVYLLYRTYKVYLGRVQDEQRHVQEVSDLHLATIEALALAIDAKDQTAQSHIRRVQVYAAGLARALGMADNEIQGVQTAALLHDIGKLAVPEHILSKPGPLTQEEFQKIRIHPQVGAEIISGVPFPYPVAPLILSHHERFDGKGYPAGLKGEDIPLGARILSVVDYFDALMSERPYHKAMSFDAAIGLLRQESGKALDPRVVQTFVEMYPALAAEADASQEPARKLTRVTTQLTADQVVKEMVQCGYVKAADLADRFGAGSSVLNPDTDPDIVGATGVFSAAEYAADNEFRKTAALRRRGHHHDGRIRLSHRRSINRRTARSARGTLHGRMPGVRRAQGRSTDDLCVQ